VLGRDVLVSKFTRDLEGAIERPGQLPRGHRVGGGAGDFGAAVQIRLDLGDQALGRGAELLQDRNDDSLVLAQQRPQKVIRRQLGVAARARVALGLLDGLLALDGQLIEPHGNALVVNSLISLSLGYRVRRRFVI
jgi:hypothetical protein